jgi:myo-inositol-1(or 4)-monophosphatase
VADATELLDLAVTAAEDAAALLREERPDTVDTKSSRTDLVTDLDHAAEERIVGRLLDARPGDGVLGEEGGERTGTSGVRWIVDPLDGTTNFVYEYPAYSVAIAAEADGQVVAGVVLDVVRSQRFTATLGGGAARDGRPVSVTGADDLATALLATGFSYLRENRARQAEVLATVLPAVRDLRRSGSAALDLCTVACGRVDGFWERGLAPWDRAAGGLIAAEAGATVGVLVDREPSTMVAASPALYEPLCELLLRGGAAF